MKYSMGGSGGITDYCGPEFMRSFAQLTLSILEGEGGVPNRQYDEILIGLFLKLLDAMEKAVEEISDQWRNEEELWMLSFKKATDIENSGLLKRFYDLYSRLNKPSSNPFLEIYPKLGCAFMICVFAKTASLNQPAAAVATAGGDDSTLAI